MSSISKIQTLIERILSKNYDSEDIANLENELLYNEEFENLRDTFIRGNKNILQIGNENINIGTARDIQIGNNIYPALSVKAIQEALHEAVLKGLSEGFKDLSANDFMGNYSVKKSISYRHLTGINEYPTLSFLEPEFPNKLKTILGIKKTPIIFTNSHVLAQLEKFTVESGNEFLISCILRPATITYCINDNNYTKSGSNNRVRKEEFSQSKEDFEKDTLDYTREDKNFEFAPVTAKFQNEIEQAQWTSILENKILQYPKLSRVKSLGKRDLWIKKIINKNHDIQGFLLFEYRYIQEISTIFGGCGFGLPKPEAFVSCIPPSPYLRFVDITNVQNKAIKIESISFNMVKKEEYELTNLDKRQDLLSSGELFVEKFNILLHPQQHLLIPIEFGFDTKAHQRLFKFSSQELPDNLSDLINKKIYVAKVPEESSIFYDFFKTLDNKILENNTNSTYRNLYYYFPEEINPLITDELRLSQEFLGAIKSTKDLFISVPRRFAVGSFMDIISLQVDGKEEKIDAPNDTPKFSMSAYFAYGSCPYLLVYNSKKGYWIELGTILRGKEHKFLQNSEIYNLGENISKIKIEERDREITYIESLSIIYTTSKNSQKEQEAIPLLTDLATREEGYFVLHQGQSMEIDLENLIPADALNVKLKLNGYYKIIQ
jgi:hypothetical protein